MTRHCQGVTTAPQSNGDFGGAGQVGFRQQQGEFLATQATEQVGVPFVQQDASGKFLQHFVANRMAELVIHFLEMIQIQHQQRKRPIVTGKPAKFFFGGLKEMSPVCHACELID